jgi:hypothetical protein
MQASQVRSVAGSQRGSISEPSALAEEMVVEQDIEVGNGDMQIRTPGLHPAPPPNTLLNDKAELLQILRTYFGTVHCECGSSV